MRWLVRLIVLGLAVYGAKALVDRYGSTVRPAPAGGDRSTATGPSAPGPVHAHVDPNSPVAQADDVVAVATQTPPRLS
jgi:hypothetical protein